MKYEYEEGQKALENFKELATAAAIHHFADALKHEPCRCLRHANGASQFVRANPVLHVRQKPECRHPLVQRDRGIFHDGFHLDGELALTGIAEPELTGFHKGVLRSRAARTNHDAIWPAQLLGVLEAAVSIGKVFNRLLQRSRLWNVLSLFHTKNDTIGSHVCQLVYCQSVRKGFTRYFGLSAIYSITPIDEATVREMLPYVDGTPATRPMSLGSYSRANGGYDEGY